MAKKTKACSSTKCEKSCKKGCKNKLAAEPAVAPVIIIDSIAVEVVTPDEPVSASEPAPTAEPAPVTPPPKNVDHAGRLNTGAANFFELYARYNTLRELAMRLNGQPQTQPFPDNVKIDKIEMTFTLDGVQKTGVLTHTRLIGEIAALIGNELNSLIEKLYVEIFELNYVAGAMQKAIETAISKPADTSPKPNTTQPK
jgi:hypothetical protein